MTAPSLALPFDPQYFEYAQHRSEVVAPKHFKVYSPDNHDDFNCLAIWEPAPELGASRWTSSGKRTLVGVYRDEGRVTQQQAVQLVTWARNGVRLVVTTSRPHYLFKGQAVQLYNVNVPTLVATVEAIISATQFQVRAPVQGGSSGTSGGYQQVDPINFYEDYVVYRLLPSFKLVKASVIAQLIQLTAPRAASYPSELLDPALGSLVKLPIALSGPVRGDNGLEGLSVVEHRQQFNELQRPLQQNYTADGDSVRSHVRSSKHQNVKTFIQPPVVSGTRRYARVFDYYGFELNDPSRGPFYAGDLIDYRAGTGLFRKQDQAGRTLYTGPIYDEFGNLVLDVLADYSLKCRDMVMPVAVDQFNAPMKAPLKRAT